MNEVNLPAIEPVTDEDYRAFTAVAFYPISLGVAAAIEQDRRRVAERQAARQAARQIVGTTGPTNVARLRELSHTVTQGPEAIRRECSMRVPAEPDRDADLVLSSAADEIERLRAEVAEADAEFADAVTLAQLNLDLLKAAEAEVAALKAACGQKDGALGICRDMLSVVHDVGQFTRSTKVAIGVAEAALSTDAGKGWIDASGAVEATVQRWEVRGAFGYFIELSVPADWAGSRVLIVPVRP